MNYHGAMLLKVLFDFQKPSKLVKSLLSLSLEEVLILANDPMGSHAFEAFLKSRSVPSDDKNTLIQKLQVTSTDAFPGYQKGTRGFLSRAAGCVGVSRRPKSRVTCDQAFFFFRGKGKKKNASFSPRLPNIKGRRTLDRRLSHERRSREKKPRFSCGSLYRLSDNDLYETGNRA